MIIASSADDEVRAHGFAAVDLSSRRAEGVFRHHTAYRPHEDESSQPTEAAVLLVSNSVAIRDRT